MNETLRKFFFLDFEKEFIVSFLKLLFFWNPLFALAVSFASGETSFASVFFNWKWNFFKVLLIGLFGMIMVKIFLFVEKIWARRSSQNSPPHGTGWYLLFLAFMVPPGLYLALRLMLATINFLYVGDPIPVEFPWQYYRNETFWIWMFFLFFFLFKSWQDLRDSARLSQLRSEELEKERLQAMLTKLKDQMNPHFLFNTLNTVASLIPADPSKAEQVVIKLSTLFQGVLESTRKSNHPLAKELEFCRDYLEIEQVRFGKRLSVRIETETGLESRKILVPVLLLQPLVENAVKHGLSSRASGGHLWVGAGLKEGHLEIWVEDDGVGFGNSTYAGSGTALENCRKRLELGFGKEGRIEISPREAGGTKVLLIMPVVTEVSEQEKK